MRAFFSGLVALCSAFPAWAGIDAWTSLPSPSGNPIVAALGTHPTNASMYYAATQGGMFVSGNGGLSWAASNSGIVKTPAGYVGINDMAITSAGIYVTPYFLQKSSDNGTSWSRTGWVSENPQALVLAADPKSPNTVYAGANQGVYKTSDGGVSWKYLAGNSPVYALAVDPGNPSVVFRAVGSGIYRSTDAGLSWSQVSTQLTSVKIIVVDPNNSAIVYAGTNASGVYKSTDGGSSWKAINHCIPQDRCSPTTMNDIWVTSIIVDSGTVYLGSSGGLYKSVDGGANWTQANNGPIGVTTMMRDPGKADTIIAAYGGKLYSYTFGTPSDSDRIFNWAQATYPQYFAPATQTQSLSGYQARYYSATQTYLGTKDGDVYVYGAIFGGMMFVGTTAQLLPTVSAAGY